MAGVAAAAAASAPPPPPPKSSCSWSAKPESGTIVKGVEERRDENGFTLLHTFKQATEAELGRQSHAEL